MANDILKGQWKQLKGRVQRQWGELTDDDLDKIKGDRNQLVGKLQEKYGRTREDIETEVNDWLDDIGDDDFDDDVFDA